MIIEKYTFEDAQEELDRTEGGRVKRDKRLSREAAKEKFWRKNNNKKIIRIARRIRVAREIAE